MFSKMAMQHTRQAPDEMRFIHDDVSDAFTYVCNGIVINDIWDSIIRYVTCPDQMRSHVFGVGIHVCVRSSRFLFGT